MKVKIYRGLPGSGKDYHIAKTFANVEHIVCSADDYYMVNGEYRYDANMIGKAQTACMQKYMLALTGGRVSYVVISNTNLLAWNISPYIAVAEAMGIEADITQIEAPVDVCIARNVHGVPAQRMLEMAATMACEKLPVHWYVTKVQSQCS